MSRVGVNLLWLETRVVGGSETYLVGLLRALAVRRPAGLEVVLFAPAPLLEAHPDLAQAFPTVRAPVPVRPKPVRVLGESTWLAWAARHAGVDLVHHAGGHVPVVHPTPSVATVHDVQWLTYPEHFSRTKLAFLRRVVPAAVRRARLLLVPSEYVKGTLVAEFGADPGRVVVVPQGLAPVPPPSRSAVGGGVRARYRLGDGPLLVYPAIVYPHKNHAVLVRALARLADRHPEATVVVTGGRAGAPDLEAALDDEAAALGVSGRFRRLGRVRAVDLDALLREATALVFPSRYEGFGAPVLEAWARDCPVVAADATALPEVVAGAGLLVAPDDADGWADAMAAVLDEPGLRGRLVGAGRARLAHFSPDRAAAALEGAYRRALSA
ncbi:MAG: glycosyltransferase family 4 protein [Acidimicrobiales bacterium]|nr:glycosyltransferase family 4 protein [Acidimicrobiales bacterium]